MQRKNTIQSTLVNYRIYLQKHLPNDPISLFFEECRKNDGNSIMLRLDVNCFLISVVDLHKVRLGVWLVVILELSLLIEGMLKRLCEKVSFN